MTLFAEPAAGKRFVRWSGACSGELSECPLTLGGPADVSALFAPETYPLTLGVTGRGSIFSAAFGSQCRNHCRVAVTSYRALTLRATALQGWRFKRWGGACHGTHVTCRLPMSAAAGATAVFVKKPKPR
jgi:hypothetical protein